MADTVTSQTIFDGERLAVMKFTDVSDGTGESAVLKVDVSTLTVNALGQTCTGVVIERIDVSINGMSVNILWDANTDVSCFVAAPGVYSFDFCKLLLTNNAGTGKTGDIRFTTIGASSNDTYSIILWMVKSYT